MAPCSRAQLLRVWRAYLDHRRPYVKETTFTQDYRPFTNRLTASPQWLETAEDLVTWLVETYSHDSARRTLQQVKAAFEWAAAAKVARRDPFVAIANLPQLSSPKNHWRAFEPSERAAILNLFDSQADHYRRWVWGLFLTGCRPEELRALTVQDVSKDLKQLAIARAWRMGAPAAHATKTGATTPDFPVNQQLGKLLRECVGDRPHGQLFTGANGGPFHYGNFQRKLWFPLVGGLAEEGAIAWYLPQKHARHTFITQALANGLDVATVAYLSRNSPAVIHRHYAQRQKAPIIPEF